MYVCVCVYVRGVDGRKWEMSGWMDRWVGERENSEGKRLKHLADIRLHIYPICILQLWYFLCHRQMAVTLVCFDHFQHGRVSAVDVR
mmetsp:Transcript_48014/g.124718  ORF Transcript_48014/g.124718 Transcript_48014/m.124718 type:complete len:87 (-) Transcript_48014:503-763(-)